MSTPVTTPLNYRKWVLSWNERPTAGPSQYEESQDRILQVFRQWATPASINFLQFVVRVGDWGGYAVLECDNIVDIHVITTALAAFSFKLEPVVDVMDAVHVELQAMAWRDGLGQI